MKTSFAYIVLYLCRLLRKIELSNSIPDEIFWIWKTYRDEFSLIDKLFSDTVSDYCFYKKIPIPYENIGEIVTKKNFIIRPFLLNLYIFDYLFEEDHKLSPTEINYLIRILTGDSFRKTKAYKTNQTFAGAVEEAMSKAFSRGLFNRKDLNENLFKIQIPSQVQTTRKLFQGLPPSETPQVDIVLSYLPLLHDNNIHDRCDEIIKYVDNRIRGIMKIKNALSRIHISGEHKAFLEGVLLEFAHLAPNDKSETQNEKTIDFPKAEPRKIQVDTKTASKIEEDSWLLTQKLTESYYDESLESVTVGGENTLQIEETIEKDLEKLNRRNPDADSNEFWEFAAQLSQEEDLFISYNLYQGKDKAREYALSLGMFFEGMVSTCNEKAVDVIGDGIMTPFGEIFSEYILNLKEVFPEMKGEEND